MAAAGTLMVFTVLLARLLGGFKEEQVVSGSFPLAGGAVFIMGMEPLGSRKVVFRGNVAAWLVVTVGGLTRCSLARDLVLGDEGRGRVASAKTRVVASRSMSTMTEPEDAWYLPTGS